MTPFYVLGGVLVVWALLISFLGIVREGFPGSKGGERLVALVSVVLVACAVGAAIVCAAAESGEHESEAAVLTPGR